MPREVTHLSTSQIRSRLRRSLSAFTGRGGGISLRVLGTACVVGTDDVIPFDLAQDLSQPTNYSADWYYPYLRKCNHIEYIRLISEACDYEQFRCVNRLWHIAVKRGSDLANARVYTVWIGDHEHAPIRMPLDFGGNLFVPTRDVSLDPVIQMENVLPSALRDDERLSARSSSRQTTDDVEEI